MVNTGDKRNGAKGTKKDNNSLINAVAGKGDANGTINYIPETVVDMLDLARVKDGEIHEEDIQKVIDVITLIQKNYKNDQVHKMYVRYQTLWETSVAEHNITNEYDDARLLQFFMKCSEKYTPNTLWVIYSCVNTTFIIKLGVSLKGLPRIHRYLEMETLHYVCKKVATFNADEVHHIMMTLEERNTPNA